MTPTQLTNYLASLDDMVQHWHEQLDLMKAQMTAILANGASLTEEPKPMNDLKPDPARSSVTRRQAIKLKTCPICGRELPLGQFRSSDNHLHDECNACREERKEEYKNKKNKKKTA